MAAEPSSELSQRRWNNLLNWLEGHGFRAPNLPVECREKTHAGKGLFVRNACKSGDLVIVIPPTALMNQMTLKRHYPPEVRVVKALSAVQLISMHLFIWRPKIGEDSADPSFGPYISVLPRDFDCHPLTWLVLSKFDGADDLRLSLLNSLPPSVLAALYRLHARFWEDWCKVRAFLKRVPSVLEQTSLTSFETHDATVGFLWAWLNVNTRCIYYRLKRAKTDPDNLTMCPILDFANHSSSQAHLVPVPSNSDKRNAAPVNLIGDGLKFISLGDVKLEENDEILLTYGLHSNKTLFVEYGFVNLLSESEPSPGGEIDVQDLVEEYVFTDARFSGTVKVALVAEGYWGDWTLHSTLQSAQPSWRLISALRLYHLVLDTGSADEHTIQMWRDVITGKRPRVSYENEQCWRRTIIRLCDELAERAEKSVALGFPGAAQHKDGNESWARWMSENIQSLWQEEVFVAGAVRECVLRGDEF